jgi:NifU-like protein
LRGASPAYFPKITADGTIKLPDTRFVEADPLDPAVRRWFESLPRSGTLKGAPGVISGEAGGVERDAWVRFHLQIADGVVKDARFQAYGCPHTLAVSAWLTAQLPGRKLSELSLGEPADWARALSVPVEKLGRLLVVEDALRACVMSKP